MPADRQRQRRRQIQRKSLRQSLRDLLQCRRRHSGVQQPKTLGSGILRRADSVSLLPSVSKVSFFPDFGSSAFDIDRFSIPTPPPYNLPAGEVLVARDYSVNTSTASLLPATRLSQFNLNQAFVDRKSTPRQVQYCVVPDILVQGASRQASFESYQSSLGPRPSCSTLKLRRSSQSLFSPPRGSESVAGRRTSSISEIRRTQSVRVLQSSKGQPKSSLSPPQDLRSNPRYPQDLRGSGYQDNAVISSVTIKHLSSFCVLDTAAPGCPVTATSEDLRYIFEVGDQFFLHNQECDGTSLDIVTGYDASGNEVTHLVLFSPLISPSSGRSRFMLAALIDITNFLLDTASLPDLEAISEESVGDDEVHTPPARRATPHPPWEQSANKYDLSAEDLLGGCFVEEVPPSGHTSFRTAGDLDPRYSEYDPLNHRHSEDVWLKLATEEKERSIYSRARASSRSPLNSPRNRSSVRSDVSRQSSVVDNVLDEFMTSLQQLYSEFFLLAKSPLDDKFYEICNVSPSVLASRDYVKGHLSHTPPHDIAALSENLGQDCAFSMLVLWGSKGQERRLYCIPLFGQSSITWICVLVDISVSFLW